MNLILARVAPARVLSDDDAHRLTVPASECRWLVVRDDAQGWEFLSACWNLGYAIVNLGEVSPGWGGVGPESFSYSFGYDVPFWEDVTVIN